MTPRRAICCSNPRGESAPRSDLRDIDHTQVYCGAVRPEPRMQPETQYATSGDLSIAYQVVGSGALDLVLVPGFISNLDHMWNEPGLVHFLSRLSSFSRLILFDKRGTGLSDRLGNLPTLEER